MTTDDRVRGGSSQSYLTTLPDNGARFYGNLDIETLGGAGFASQFSPIRTSNDEAATEKDENGSAVQNWDLSPYDGLTIEYSLDETGEERLQQEQKVYTLILRDRGADDEAREDGRAKASVNWEYDFLVGEGEKLVTAVESKVGDSQAKQQVWIPWAHFRATFRGRDVDDAGELRKSNVWRIGIMMRRYDTLIHIWASYRLLRVSASLLMNYSLFGKQKGSFDIQLWSLRAEKRSNQTKSEL